MPEYWDKRDIEETAQAETYADLYIIARRILSRIPHPIVQLCGPISSGGAGSIEENLKRFDATITKLQSDGLSIFNQVPFEHPMQRLKEKEGVSWSMRLLEEFYLPIFENALVDELHFLPDWQSSKGAR